MRLFTFTTDLWLPRAPGEIFPFFGDARNLQAITPAWLDFQIVTPGSITMQAGTLIDYRLRVHGVPLRWRTRINVWEPPHRFVDEQLRGPYRQWLHEHTFAEQNGGTLARDVVRYAVPGGALVNWLFVRRDVERIFIHRQAKLRERFG
ncbi:MAG TPA: SRPBCC family protein [Verrucomicrobiae bacterium]|nr:SRPBCC family protein [Verrucomicrobiae bacterium]